MFNCNKSTPDRVDFLFIGLPNRYEDFYLSWGRYLVIHLLKVVYILPQGDLQRHGEEAKGVVGVIMRLDKFLKVARIIKRRTLAKEVCDGGKVMVNGRVAKAGLEVKPGDQVELRVGSRNLSFEIVEIRETVPAKEAASLYKILSGL